MNEFFLELNTGIYPGIAIFMTLMAGIVEFYKNMHDEITLAGHKKILEESIGFFSKISFAKVPKYSAKLTTSFFDTIFIKPFRYRIFDPIFWNFRILIFFTSAIALTQFLLIYSWQKSLFSTFILSYPFIILAVDIIAFHFLKRGELLKAAMNKDEEKFRKIKTENDFHWIISTTLKHAAILSLMLLASFAFSSQIKADLLPIIHNFIIFALYFFICIFSLTISRILIYDLTKTKSLIDFSSLFVMFSSLVIIFTFLSAFLSSQISLNFISQINDGDWLKVLGTEPEKNFPWETQLIALMVTPILFPIIIFISVFLLGLTSRILIHPMQKLVTQILLFIIKYNLYLYLISATTILLIVLIFN